MKNILFICSANKDRSKTAEDYFSENFNDFNFDSAGTNKKICQQLATNYLSKKQLAWADRIFVMEDKHLLYINKYIETKHLKKTSVLHIKDLYSYGSKELIDELNTKISLSKLFT